MGFIQNITIQIIVLFIWISSTCVFFVLRAIKERKLFFFLVCIGSMIFGMSVTINHLKSIESKTRDAYRYVHNHPKQHFFGTVESIPIKNKAGAWTFNMSLIHDGKKLPFLTSVSILIQGAMQPPLLAETIHGEGTISFITTRNNLSLYLKEAITTKTTLTHLSKVHEQSIFFQSMKWREALLHNIQTYWPGDTGGLIAGILVGEQQGLSKEASNSFKITGLSHIVVVSGFNITLIIVFVGIIFKNVQRRIRYPTTIILIIFFCYFVGGSSAVLRAGLMGIIQILALSAQKKTTITHILFLSAAGICLWNPAYLIYDIGFQLSCLAVLGLLFATEYMKYYCWMFQKNGTIHELVSTTLAAQVFTLPLMIGYFQKCSLISPLTNILVPPLVAPLMAFSSASLLVPIPFIGQLLRTITLFLSKSILTISSLCASLPFAAIPIEEGWIIPLSLLYILLLFHIMKFHFKNGKKP